MFWSFSLTFRMACNSRLVCLLIKSMWATDTEFLLLLSRSCVFGFALMSLKMFFIFLNSNFLKINVFLRWLICFMKSIERFFW